MKLSIEATPVIKGTLTGARAIMPGARASTGVHVVLNKLANVNSLYAKLEHIKYSPNGFIISPSTPKPQRVLTNLLVLYTESPTHKVS